MEEKRYLISDAAKLTEVEAHVLRYWEEELDLVIGRTELGHRYYTRENLKTFQRIKELKEKGLQLKAIREVLKEEEQQISEKGRQMPNDYAGIQHIASGTAGETERMEEPVPRQKWQEHEGTKLSAALLGKDACREQAGDADMQPDQPVKIRASQERAARTGRETMRAGETGACREQAAGAGGETSACQEQAGDAGMGTDPLGKYIDIDGQALPALKENTEKLRHFEELVSEIVDRVVRENNEELRQRIEEAFSRETEELIRMQELQEEERFRRLDEAIRMHQLAGREAAAAQEGGLLRRWLRRWLDL